MKMFTRQTDLISKSAAWNIKLKNNLIIKLKICLHHNIRLGKVPVDWVARWVFKNIPSELNIYLIVRISRHHIINFFCTMICIDDFYLQQYYFPRNLENMPRCYRKCMFSKQVIIVHSLSFLKCWTKHQYLAQMSIHPFTHIRDHNLLVKNIYQEN